MILVDFSGTIAMHKDAVRKVFNELDLPFFRERGYKGSENDLRRVFGKASRNLRGTDAKQGAFALEVGRILGLDISTEDAHEKGQKFDELYVKFIEPVEGVKESLEELSEMDDLVLITNAKGRRVLPVVEKFGIKDLFKQILCLGGTTRSKGPEIFDQMRDMGAWAIVGDSPRRDGIAKESGIQFVDVRVGWGTAVNLVKNLKKEKLRLKT